jgi:hypothetical protein
MSRKVHTGRDIARAARRFDELAEALDIGTVKVEDTEDLRAIAVAQEALKAAEARLAEAINVARAHNRSWNRIAIPLGITRQAARQRFATGPAEARPAGARAARREQPAKSAKRVGGSRPVKTAAKAPTRRRAAG